MDAPCLHRHHGGCRGGISLAAMLLVGAIVTTACSGQLEDLGASATAPLPAPALTVSLTANPTAVDMSGSSILTWSSTDAVSCEASGAWSGSKPLSGSEIVGPLTTSSTFVLTCNGTANDVQLKVAKSDLVAAPALASDPVSINVSASEAVTVTVGGLPPPLPTVSLTANPTAVDMSGSSILTWSSTDAVSCEASGAWSGSKPLSGNQSVGPLTETSTFTLTCTGPSGSTSRPATVNVLTATEPPGPCSTSLFSPDLAGQVRASPATMGALEVAGVDCQ